MEKVVSNLLKNNSKHYDVSLIVINKENDVNALKSLNSKKINFIKRKKRFKKYFKAF